MSLTFATQLTAIATALLAVGAVVTAIFAFLAFRKQAVEVQLLQEQAQRDIEERRRTQAAQVYISVQDLPFEDNPADMRPAARLRNESALPIYDIVLGLGGSAEQNRKVLPPRDELVRPGLGSAFANGQRPVWATFRDSAGIRWRVTAAGELSELHGENVVGPGHT